VTSQAEMFDKPRVHTRLPGEGYAASPGSGPKGETCGSCGNHREKRWKVNGQQRGFNKCALVKRSWSKTTDIRLDAPACLHWIKQT
jgi:hypothetical protein